MKLRPFYGVDLSGPDAEPRRPASLIHVEPDGWAIIALCSKPKTPCGVVSEMA